MNFGVIREAWAEMLRTNLPEGLVNDVLPRAPESVNPPIIYLADGRASVDLTMQQRIWDWSVPLNIAVVNMKDYPRERVEAEKILAEIVPHIDTHYSLSAELAGTGIQTFGLNFTELEEGGLRVGNIVYAGTSLIFRVKCKFPVTLIG